MGPGWQKQSSSEGAKETLAAIPELPTLAAKNAARMGHPPTGVARSAKSKAGPPVEELHTGVLDIIDKFFEALVTAAVARSFYVVRPSGE